MRNFIWIWIGQLVSLIGTWMASFVLDIWVFQKTGSATQFALVTLTTSLPLILASPIAGTLIDRWNRRWTVIISDACIGICIVILTILVSQNQLAIWHIYVINTLISIFSSFQNPAYKALITCLVPLTELGRITGLVQLAISVQQIISPLLAGILVGILDMQGILMIDLGTVIIALIPLLITKIVEPEQCTLENSSKISLWQETISGWNYIQQRSELFGFMILYGIYQFLYSCIFIIAYPLILSLTNPSTLGIIIFMGGIGMLTSAIIISVWGDKWQNLSSIVLISMLFSGILMIMGGIRPSITQFGISTLLFFFSTAIINGLSQLIFQKSVEPQFQGRIFSLTGAIATSGLPLAAVIAAPLGDNILEPLMAFNGPWADTIIGQIIGSGPGRGFSLLFVIVGIFTLVVTFFGSQYPTIRKL